VSEPRGWVPTLVFAVFVLLGYYLSYYTAVLIRGRRQRLMETAP
jgi:hypothetical protein